MATYLTQSVSESFQASLIDQHHDQIRQNYEVTQGEKPISEHVGDGNERRDEGRDSNQTISVCSQCLLVAAFIGIEVSACFTLIYNVLFLQFLGVPTSLVSIGGVACGCTAFILLPLIGWFSDRGSNRVKRKVCMMLIGYSAYAVGYLLIAVCSVLKLYPDHTQQTNYTHDTDYNKFQSSVLGEKVNGNQQILHDSTNHTNSLYNLMTAISTNTTIHSSIFLDSNIQNNKIESPTSLSLTGYGGIIAFCLLDIAFDSCTSLCRAFVLECSPPALHSRLLVMSTAFGSVWGCLLSFVAAFDIPLSLGTMFQVDGTAATVLMFSCVIFLLVTSSFICTLVTGYKLAMKNTKQGQNVNINSSDHAALCDNPRHGNKPWSRTSSKTKLSSEDLSQGQSLRQPLLSQYNNSKDYFTLSKPVENMNTNEKSNLLPLKITEDDSNILYENKLLDVKFRRENYSGDNSNNKNNDDIEYDNNSLSISKSGSEVEAVDGNVEERINDKYNQKNSGISSFVSSVLNSYSISMSNAPISQIGDSFQIQKIEEESPNDQSGMTKNQRSPWKNKRLLILCLSMFFTMGSMLAFSMYGGNTLTIGVYHGDPMAHLGTPGRDRYDKGLRRAALGFLVCYLVYMTFSVLNKKIIDRIGEKPQYIMCQVALVAVNLALVLVPTEAMYFVTAGVSGLYRACAFTLGYVLANKFTQEDCASTGGNLNDNIGKVMVMIGMMMPASYLVISSFMGPMMSALDNAFVPVISGGFTAAMSLLVICMLYIVKR